LLLDADQQPKALYDLEADPLEMFNLLTEMPAKAQGLATKHRTFFEKIRQDPLRPSNP
jgi:arylsulfatase A-like enzyme